MDTAQFTKAIKKSQHCQRNWDLSKKIPSQDLELLKTAVTECPSKQNIAFYNVHFITNRDVVESIHEATNGFHISYEDSTLTTTNSQVLANLLVVFEHLPIEKLWEQDPYRNLETYKLKKGEITGLEEESLKSDQKLAIGIAAGYLNLMSSLLGYSTGCCSCFDKQRVAEILNMENDAALLMGVGFSNSDLGRRIHHKDHDFLFPTKTKQKIGFSLID